MHPYFLVVFKTKKYSLKPSRVLHVLAQFNCVLSALTVKEVTSMIGNYLCSYLYVIITYIYTYYL